MLKYFKRQNSRRKSSDTNSQEANDAAADVTDSAKRHSLRSTSSFCEEIFLDEVTSLEEEDVASVSCAMSISASSTELLMAEDEDIFKYHSRLSMSLQSIVNDPDCLTYFVQYLETRNELALIKFYLDTEYFKNAAKSQQFKEISSDKMDTSHLEVGNQSTIENTIEEVIKNNAVPELKTICDLSMRKPLTDDEKSQIYAETNKQIIKCNNYKHNKSSSELSLCSESTTVTEPESENKSTNIRLCDASIKDAIAIYKKYLIGDAKHFVCLPVTILSQISLLLCEDNARYENMDAMISANCFDEAQQHVLENLEKNYLNDFQQSIFYCKYCIQLFEKDAINRTQKLTIYDILYSEVTLFFFMEYLEQNGERDCLDFWTAAINFRKSYAADTGSRNELEAQTDAMIIYEKYFSLQSERRLWMSDKLRSHVEERICAIGNVAYCFDLPIQIIAKYLEKKYFEDFLNSQLFENYVNELKTKVHEESTIGILANNCDSPAVNKTTQQKSSLRRAYSLHTPIRHRKTLSDCTNESTNDLLKHISQQNTLLASMDTTRIKNIHTTGTSLNIDSRQLTDPKLLWRRSISTEGGLKFGYVNALGRYERDFEAVDSLNNATKHNWSLTLGGNKIKNAMRKLVNLPEDKVQEEIAWQVAEMIVKDVTNVTLCDGKMSYK